MVQWPDIRGQASHNTANLRPWPRNCKRRDRETFLVNPEKMEAKIMPNTKAIPPVHIYGLPSDIYCRGAKVLLPSLYGLS